MVLLAVPGGLGAETEGLFFPQYFHEVLIDVDNDPTTGGPVPLVQAGVPLHDEPGFEYRAVIHADRCLGQHSWNRLYRWDGDSFEAVAVDDVTQYPLGFNQGSGGSTLIEWQAPSASIPEGLAGARIIFHASRAAAANDYTEAVVLGLPTLLEVPALSGAGLVALGLALAAAGIALRRRRGGGARAALAFALLLAGAGAVWAGGSFVMDGQSGDWAGLDPVVLDPAGDSSVPDANEDIFNGFVVPGASEHTFRMDVGSAAIACA
jgi:hypothetical protein